MIKNRQGTDDFIPVFFKVVLIFLLRVIQNRHRTDAFITVSLKVFLVFLFSNTNCQRLKKTPRRTALLSHAISTRSQCLTAAAEGAKLSTIYEIAGGPGGRSAADAEAAEQINRRNNGTHPEFFT